MMRHKKPSHNQRRQANKVAKLKVHNETPRKTKSANTSKSTPASERKTKYRIPKISKQAKVESNPIPSELASILKDLQKCRPVLKDYSPATNALITRVVQEEHTDSSDDQDSDWEVEEEKANSKLSLENVTLAAVAEFSNLEDALHNLVDTDELVKVMVLLCNRVNSILPGPIVEQMSQTTDISFIYIHLFKELKQVAPEMRLILYPVLFCYLATTVFNTANSQELFIWPQLMAEYDRFLQIFSGEIKPLHLLASIHTSFQQIFEKSKSMEEMTSLYGKVMPLYNSIFMHVLKGREMQFSEIDVDVFGCILFDLLGFNSLFSCVDNLQKYNIIDTTSEDLTTGQVFHMIFSCCGENASAVFDTFTSSLYQYLSAKPLEFALQRWLELVKSLSSPVSHLFPHIFFLAAKQIGSHIGRARKRPLKNTLATYSSVKKQLKRIAAHLKRTPISSGSVNEANYLIAMLYYAPSVLHLRHDDLAPLANWFNDTLDQALSRLNKMILAQLTPEKLVLVGVNGQIVEDDEYGSV